MVERLQTRLHPVSAYVVLPVFALANAGVALGGGVLGDAVGSAVALGIALGLVVGKPVGILLAAFLAVRLGLGRLPEDTGWRMLAGLGAVGGIGFTVSLFIAGLSFPGDELLTERGEGRHPRRLAAVRRGRRGCCCSWPRRRSAPNLTGARSLLVGGARSPPSP